MDDVPSEVIETAKKITSYIFTKVKKPTFEFIPGTGLVMKFYITDQDFNYIDKNEEFIKIFSHYNYENIFMNLCKNKNGIELFSKILFRLEENQNIHKIESLLRFYKDEYYQIECICEFLFLKEENLFVIMIIK